MRNSASDFIFPPLKNRGSSFRRAFLVTVTALSLLLPARSTFAENNTITKWWNGKSGSGDLLGIRPVLEEHGFSINGRWRGIYYGILSSENGPASAFPEEVVITARLDFAKACRLPSLEGLGSFGEVRWRDPGYAANPNNTVDADSLFNPSRYSGGVGLRLMAFGLEYVAPTAFGVEDGLRLRGGWIQPQREFIEQPISRLFANNAMGSSEGLGGNIPYGSSFTTWGGTIEVKPSEITYAKVGLFMSYFNPTNPLNNGVLFAGTPDEGNGLFFMGESGIRPEIGSGKLPGHYAFGGYFYGESNEEFGGNKFGFYWQADQMLWRESGEQGLSMFSLWAFAPKYNNDFSFYVQGGFAYEGAIPHRDSDQLLLGMAIGQYSYYDLMEARSEGEPEATNTILFELGYRIKVNEWCFIQPFGQYIVRPDGTPEVANASIIGVSMGLDF